MSPVLEFVETLRIATIVGGSSLLTGTLSAAHLLGLTLITGGALVSSLTLLGVMFPDRPVPDVTGAARRGMTLGLAISIATGLLLLAPRASASLDNGTFRLKMLLLSAAVVFHFVLFRPVTRRADPTRALRRLTGSLGLTLWLGVALAGCAFILIE